MRQLSLQDIRARFAQWIESPRRPAPVYAIPFGKLGTTENIPVISNMAEAVHASWTDPLQNDILAERRNLDPGVYDVWWYFALSNTGNFALSLNVEDNDGNVRYGTGFPFGHVEDGGASTGRIAFMTLEQDDAIVFRNDTAITGTKLVYANATFVQRLP